MAVGRVIGWPFLLLAVIAAGYEAVEAYQSGEYRLLALGEHWYRLHPGSLNGAQAGIQRYIAPWLWEPGITTILLRPAWLVFALPGALLTWTCRRRKRVPIRRLP